MFMFVLRSDFVMRAGSLSLHALRRHRVARRHSSSRAHSPAGGTDSGGESRRHGGPGGRQALDNKGQLEQGQLALSARLDLVEAEAEEGLFGIGEVEKINLAGEVTGA